MGNTFSTELNCKNHVVTPSSEKIDTLKVPVVKVDEIAKEIRFVLKLMSKGMR